MSSIKLLPGMAVIVIDGIEDDDDAEPLRVWLAIDPDEPSVMNRAGAAELGQLLIDQAHRAPASC